MSKLRVAVLRGGPSNEYDVSLKTGATVLKHLDREKYQPLDIFIDKNASWHVDGVVTNPLDLRHRVDVAWNALHGSYGEDGEVQRLLESIDLPYTGSGVVASAVAMHKAKAKEVFVRHGLSVAPGIEVELSVIDDADVREIFRSLPPPYIVKMTIVVP
jgi:D-alanine-D-alanine ligase